MKNAVTVFITLFVLIVLSRWMSHVWNFTVCGGAFLFAGAYFKDKKISMALMLSSMLVSDAIIGFHAQMPAVYLSYALIVGLGLFLKQDSSRVKVFGFSVLASTLFYFVTNFAVWASATPMYPMTAEGLMECLIAGLPFYRNQLFGDILSALVAFEVARVAGVWVEKKAQA